MEGTKYYIAQVRLHQQDGYLLWVEKPEVEYLWANERNLAPAIKSPQKVEELAQQQGFPLEVNQPQLLNLDAVERWMHKPEKIPPPDCLGAWNMFNDLSRGINKGFAGDTKGPVRNRVFDLLYLTSGIWRNQALAVWSRQERKVLHRTLRQGFRLWSKHVYWAEL
ncbi:MAG: hypothetical protein M3Y54_12205 [Bacteroidota bacterium]|nr:hypothetical protein [Bacteroidota bacterium]